MRFSQDTSSSGYTIHAFDSSGITVRAPDGRMALLQSSFIIAADRLVSDWPPPSLELLTPDHLSAVLQLGPEVVLLGTGQSQRFPSAALLASLINAGIGYEIMNTAAACRTYNVLIGEGRRVVAALLLP